jgi:serine/threonine protein kinase
MSDLEGKTLDHYNLKRLMGKGGMANVYLGYDSHFNREVAVKVFKREDENLLRRFIREAHLMSSLSNAHLIPIYDAGSIMLDGANIYYIVMPLMEGGTLRARIRNNPLPPSEACRYLSDIADALDYIHGQGIIHRDIKSSNILLDGNGRCYLSDFGIAHASTDLTQLTSTGNIMGTVDYLAPELVENDQRANVGSDLYSLGVLLFEMVTGVLPFRGENQIAVIAMHVSKRPPSPRSIVPTLSRGVERVIYKALEKRPELRYESATKLAEAFCHAAKQRLPEEQLAEPPWDQTMVAVSGGYVQDTQHFTQLKNGSLSPLITGSLPAAKSTSIYPGGSLSHLQSAYTPKFLPPNRGRRSPTNMRTIIVTMMAVLALLAVLIPAIYVMATQSSRQSADRAHALATAQAMQNFAATAQSVANMTATQQDQNATATVQALATATMQANATATVQALATATAQALATATAQANAIASATASVIQTAMAGPLIYGDPFSDPQDANQMSGWDSKKNACTFQQDGYHVMVKSGAASGLQGCYQSGQQFQDSTIKVDMRIVSGQSGGLFLRANNQGVNSGYLFEVDSKGEYRLSSSSDFTQGRTTLQDWTASSALNKGFGMNNTLEVIVQGHTLKLYANGGFLTVVQNATFPDAGYIGLQASTDNQNQSADVAYTNLKVYQA